jgi:hypothetical protein
MWKTNAGAETLHRRTPQPDGYPYRRAGLCRAARWSGMSDAMTRDELVRIAKGREKLARADVDTHRCGYARPDRAQTSPRETMRGAPTQQLADYRP